jgi:hypothetical protein
MLGPHTSFEDFRRSGGSFLLKWAPHVYPSSFLYTWVDTWVDQ